MVSAGQHERSEQHTRQRDGWREWGGGVKNDLSRQVAKLFFSNWIITQSEDCWEARNSFGEVKWTYPLHWLESSIRASLEGRLEDVEHDANAALTLTVAGYALGLHQELDGQWWAGYTKTDKGFMSDLRVASGRAATPAVAICESFVALCAVVGDGGGVT